MTSGTGAYGGHASGGGGSWNATGAYGGHASGGGGSWSATNAYGTTAYHTTGYGTTAYGTTVHGTTAYYGGAYYGGYHPPTTVNYYGSGCYNCGGWSTAGAAAAGAAVGLVAGAAVASANTSAATSSAYSAGYAAGSEYAMNAIYATLPSGAAPDTIGGTTYYVSSGTWFKPYFGANGVYYRVVPAP